jgi:cell division protein FtsW
MERVEKKTSDFLLVFLLVLLVGIGLSVLYSASSFHALKIGKAASFFFQRQLLWIALGAMAGFVASCTPLELFRRATPALIIISLFLLLLTFVPGISQSVMGARRWIFIFGISFQPAEMVKASLVLYLANILNKKEDNINDPIHSLLPPLIVVALFVSLILLQNDYSTAFFILFVALLLFFIARVKIGYFLLLASFFIPLSLILLFTKEHRVLRLISYLDPERDPSGTGFQMIQAKLALIKGGLWGTGLGMGAKKLGPLPEAHSDYVFAVLGEEMGLLGILFIILLFVFFAFRGYLVAYRSDDSFSYYLAFGVTTMIFFQALLNMAMVAGLLPTAGVPLPFFSAGGSSILATLFMSGMLVNVSRDANLRKGYLYV